MAEYEKPGNFDELMAQKMDKKTKQEIKRRKKKSNDDIKKELESLKTLPKLYKEGKKIIEDSLPVRLVPSFAPGSICHHTIYSVARPESHPGIKYPKDFRYFKLMSGDDLDNFMDQWQLVAEQMSLECAQFWMPLFFPGTRGPQLAHYTQQKLLVQSEHERQYSRNYELGISFLPSTCNGEIPLAFIPEKSWFDERFNEIEPKDVFALFPRPEMEIFMSCIGRAAVGRTHSIPVGWDEPIDHTFRTMPIVYGIDTGTGKSILTNLIRDAFKSVGYQVREFNTLGDRFNLGPIMGAHIAYKDDMVSKALEATLKSDRTKTLITNGHQLVEDKGTDAYTQACHAMVLANVNRYDPNMVYDLDVGILARTSLLKTHHRKALEEMVKKADGASEGTPSFLTWIHLKYLAQKYETTEIAIILWIIRLCADKFWSLIKDSKSSLNNRLEEDMRYWGSRLVETFKPAIENNVILFMHLAKALRSSDLKKFQIPEMSCIAFKDCLQAMHYVFIDPRANEARELVKEDWEKKDRPVLHPWHGIRNLDKQSVDGAYKEVGRWAAEHSQQWTDRAGLIKVVFGTLSLRNGFKIGSGHVPIVSAWNDCREVYQDDMVALAAKIKRSLEKHFPIFLANLEDESTVTSTDHLYNFQYDPDSTVQALKLDQRNNVGSQNKQSVPRSE